MLTLRHLVLAAVAALALIAATGAAPAEAKAKRCGSVANGGNRVEVRVARGKLSCTKAREVLRFALKNASGYAGGRQPAGWSCWHAPAVDQERGVLGGCRRKTATLSFHVVRR